MRSVAGENDRLVSSMPDLILITPDVTIVTSRPDITSSSVVAPPVRTHQSGLHDSLTPDGVAPPVSGHLPANLPSSLTIFRPGASVLSLVSWQSVSIRMKVYPSTAVAQIL